MVALVLFTGVDAVLAAVFDSFDVVDSPVALDDCATLYVEATTCKDVPVVVAARVIVVADVAVLVRVTVGAVAALETYVVPAVGVPIALVVDAVDVLLSTAGSDVVLNPDAADGSDTPVLSEALAAALGSIVTVDAAVVNLA